MLLQLLTEMVSQPQTTTSTTKAIASWNWVPEVEIAEAQTILKEAAFPMELSTSKSSLPMEELPSPPQDSLIECLLLQMAELLTSPSTAPTRQLELQVATPSALTWNLSMKQLMEDTESLLFLKADL